MSDIQRIIVALNSIKVGDLDLIQEKLTEIRGALVACGLEEKALILEQAQEAARICGINILAQAYAACEEDWGCLESCEWDTGERPDSRLQTARG